MRLNMPALLVPECCICYSFRAAMSTLQSTSPPSPPERPLPPAPGETSTRTLDTETSYLRRALWLETAAAKALSIKNPSPMAVAAHALEMRPEWAKATWRQYKAALLFRYGAMGTNDALQACALLRDAGQGTCASKTKRTSGRRAKVVPQSALDAIVRKARESSSEYGPLLTTWLLLGAEIGLRPHEWGQAEVLHLYPEHVGDVQSPPGTILPYLRIRNSKGTNGRSHGEYRHLNLAALPAELVKAVASFAQLMTQAARSGQYEKLYQGCAKLLYRINCDIHSDDSRQWVQLYSPRHRFSSEAKKALDLEGVAALMGHGTNKTAAKHYGRAISATGSLGPKPIAAEIARVRKVRQARAGTAARPAPAQLPPPDNKVAGG